MYHLTVTILNKTRPIRLLVQCRIRSQCLWNIYTIQIVLKDENGSDNHTHSEPKILGSKTSSTGVQQAKDNGPHSFVFMQTFTNFLIDGLTNICPLIINHMIWMNSIVSAKVFEMLLALRMALDITSISPFHSRLVINHTQLFWTVPYIVHVSKTFTGTIIRTNSRLIFFLDTFCSSWVTLLLDLCCRLLLIQK